MKKLMLVVLTAAVMAGCGTEKCAQAKTASFADFDARAKAGEQLTVVFFGGSLTWSANASDPNVTGFRGLMADYFLKKYPKAQFRFVDASIGGTASNLAIFRLDRDVLAKDPDLVFLEFICNDGGENRDLLNTCCYESLLRRMIGAGIPVQQMFFTFKWWVQNGAPYEKTHQRIVDYRKLAEVYQTAVGDIYQDTKLTAEPAGKIWPIDGGHPGDYGYTFFAQAGIVGYERAVAAKTACVVPKQPVFGTVENLQRLDAEKLSLPKGWSRKLTFRNAGWFDGMAARRMGDVAVSSGKDAEPLKVSATANLIGIFGEGDDRGLKCEVWNDGAKWTTFDLSPHVGAPLFVWRFQTMKDWAKGVTGEHQLEFRPVPPADEKTQGEVRIGAICTATLKPATAGVASDGKAAAAALEKIDHARGK